MQEETQNTYPHFMNAPLLLEALDKGIPPLQIETFSIEPFQPQLEHLLSFTCIFKLKKDKEPSQQSQVEFSFQLPIELSPVPQRDEVRGPIRKSPLSSHKTHVQSFLIFVDRLLFYFNPHYVTWFKRAKRHRPYYQAIFSLTVPNADQHLLRDSFGLLHSPLGQGNTKAS